MSRPNPFVRLVAVSLVSTLLGLSGCIPKMAVEWAPAAQLRVPEAARYPNASSVILNRDVRLLAFAGRTESPFTEIHEHVVRAVLTPAGVEPSTEVRIPFGDDATLVSLRARAIAPGGQVTDLVIPAKLEIKDLESASDHEYFDKYKVFRFPDVRPGSILEYSYSVRGPGLASSWLDRVAAGVPVQSYTAEILTTKVVAWWIKPYKVEAGFQKDQQGDFTHISLRLNDVPGSGTEDLAPQSTARDPYWVFVVRGVDLDYSVQRLNADWPRTMEALAKGLYLDDKYYAKAPAAIAAAECTGKDKKCIIEKALYTVHKDTGIDAAPRGNKPRPLDEVIKAGSADRFEKAILLFHYLRQAKITARFAATRLHHFVPVDPDQLNAKQFDHYLLYVPSQEGISEDLWLDPACEHCGINQVTRTDISEQALVFWAERGRFGVQDTYAVFMPIKADAAVSNLNVRTFEARLLPDGTLDVNSVLELRGTEAVELATVRAAWTAEQWRTVAESFVHDRAPTGKLVDTTQPVFNKSAGTLSRTIHFIVPAYGAVQGDKLVVPLSVLHTSWDDYFLPTSRKEEVHIASDNKVEEVATFVLPAGYRVVESPAPEQRSGLGMKYAFEVTSAAGAISARRSLSVKAGRYPLEKYPEIRAFTRGFADLRGKSVILTNAPAEPTPVAAVPPEPAPAPATVKGPAKAAAMIGKPPAKAAAPVVKPTTTPVPNSVANPPAIKTPAP